MKKEQRDFAGLALSFLYIVFLIISLIITFTVPNENKNVVLHLLVWSISGTIVAIFLMLIYAGTTDALTKFIVKHVEERKAVYSWKEMLKDFLHSIGGVIDLILSILIPGAISLWHFGTQDIDSIANLLIVALIPSLLIIKIYEYGKIIVLGLKELAIAILQFVGDLLETIRIIIMIKFEKK